jgi:hypothetical protein
MHEKKVRRPYYRELALSGSVYAVLLFGSIALGRPITDGVLRTLVLISPMIGFALMLRAIARHVSRVDEYMRQRKLESFAFAAAITAGLTFSYGFLETCGYPRISMFAVWPVMAVSFGLTEFMRARLQK